MPTRLYIAVAPLVYLLAAPGSLVAQDDETPASPRALLVFAVGVFDVGRDADTAQFEVQWRSRPGWLSLRLNAGLMATHREDLYAYLGLRRDLPLGDRWGLSLAAAAGAWEQGESLELGGALEFRSAVELFVRTSQRSRWAIEFSHLSNASLYETNPGANSIALSYARRL